MLIGHLPHEKTQMSDEMDHLLRQSNQVVLLTRVQFDVQMKIMGGHLESSGEMTDRSDDVYEQESADWTEEWGDHDRRRLRRQCPEQVMEVEVELPRPTVLRPMVTGVEGVEILKLDEDSFGQSPRNDSWLKKAYRFDYDGERKDRRCHWSESTMKKSEEFPERCRWHRSTNQSPVSFSRSKEKHHLTSLLLCCQAECTALLSGCRANCLASAIIGGKPAKTTLMLFAQLWVGNEYFVSACLIPVEVGRWRLNLRSFRSLDRSLAARDWHVELYSMYCRRWPVDFDQQWPFLSVEYREWLPLLHERVSRSSLTIEEREATNHTLWRTHRTESLHPLAGASIPSVSPTVPEEGRNVLR